MPASRLTDILGGESPLPAAAVAFDRADRGIGGPAHQLPELGLSPFVAQTRSRIRAADAADGDR